MMGDSSPIGRPNCGRRRSIRGSQAHVARHQGDELLLGVRPEIAGSRAGSAAFRRVAMANQASTCTTRPYDRRRDVAERISI
jgi:hypothetical protein